VKKNQTPMHSGISGRFNIVGRHLRRPAGQKKKKKTSPTGGGIFLHPCARGKIQPLRPCGAPGRLNIVGRRLRRPADPRKKTSPTRRGYLSSAPHPQQESTPQALRHLWPIGDSRPAPVSARWPEEEDIPHWREYFSSPLRPREADA